MKILSLNWFIDQDYIIFLSDLIIYIWCKIESSYNDYLYESKEFILNHLRNVLEKFGWYRLISNRNSIHLELLSRTDFNETWHMFSVPVMWWQAIDQCVSNIHWVALYRHRRGIPIWHKYAAFRWVTSSENWGPPRSNCRCHRRRYRPVAEMSTSN